MARSLQVVVYMEQELLDRIDGAAQDYYDNRSEWIRTACEQRLNRNKSQEPARD